MSYGAQSLAGKILMSKSLEAVHQERVPKRAEMLDRRTVTSSTMIGDLNCYAQGQMSHGRAVENSGLKHRHADTGRRIKMSSTGSWRSSSRDKGRISATEAALLLIAERHDFSGAAKKFFSDPLFVVILSRAIFAR